MPSTPVALCPSSLGSLSIPGCGWAQFKIRMLSISAVQGSGHHVSQHLGPTIHSSILRNAQRMLLLFAATNVILRLKVSGKISGQKFQRPFPFSGHVLEGDPGPSQGKAPEPSAWGCPGPLGPGPQLLPGPSVAPAPHALVHLTLIGRARSTETSCCGPPALSTHTLVGTPTLPARSHFSCPPSGGQGHLPAL